MFFTEQTKKFFCKTKQRSEFHSAFSLYLCTTLCIAQQKRSKGVNVVSKGSPSLILIVLLISFGITTLPKSSILLTIPVAFIYKISFVDLITFLLSVNKGVLYYSFTIINNIIYFTVPYKSIIYELKNYKRTQWL